MEFKNEKGEEIQYNDLPRLVVLTGLNGSGKTRGLQKLASRTSEHSRYIHYIDFKVNWVADVYDKGLGLPARRMLEAELSDFFGEPQLFNNSGQRPWWQFVDWSPEERIRWLSTQSCGFAKSYQIFRSIFSEHESIPIERHADLLNDEARAATYWSEVSKLFRISHCASVFTDRRDKPLHLLTSKDFLQAVAVLFGRVFPLNHALHAEFNEYGKKAGNFLYEQYMQDIPRQEAWANLVKAHPFPWSQLDRLIEELGINEKDVKVFQFQIDHPFRKNPMDFDTLMNWRSGSGSYFQEVIGLKAHNDSHRKLEDLSSGEKTLLALATLLHTHQQIHPRLDALYLDEIDASLHPTMISAMLEILQKQSDSTRIFLATHSPTTVALAPKDSLFLVERDTAHKVSRKDAVEGLTQGYFTTEGISSFLGKIRRDIKQKTVVLSEGENHEYLKVILEKLNYSEHIHVFEWTKSGGKGVTNLQWLWELISELVTTPWQKKQLVFLFDCDAANTIKNWKGQKAGPAVWAIALNEIKSHKVKKGIENLVPDHVLDKLGIPEANLYRKGDPRNGVENHKGKICKKYLDELRADPCQIDLDALRHALQGLIAVHKQGKEDTRPDSPDPQNE